MSWFSDTLKSFIRSPLVNMIPGGSIISAGTNLYDAAKGRSTGLTPNQVFQQGLAKVNTNPRFKAGTDIALAASQAPNAALAKQLKGVAADTAKKGAKLAGKAFATDAVFDVVTGDDESTAKKLFDAVKEEAKDFAKKTTVNKLWEKFGDRVPDQYKERAEESLTKRGYLNKVSKPNLSDIMDKTKSGGNYEKSGKKKSKRKNSKKSSKTGNKKKSNGKSRGSATSRRL